MKAWKKYIFLFLAYSITLMHTLVPHQHKQEIMPDTAAVVQVKNPGCIPMLGLFQLLFAADLGSNHLEKFKKGNPEFPELSFVSIFLYSALAVLLSLLLQGNFIKQLNSGTQKLHLRLLLAGCKGLRAPPLFA